MSKDWKNNLFAGLNSLAATAGAVTGASTESTPQDIPREELMTLCMKMNKRMQAMETKGKELVKKKTTMLSERRKMLDMFRMVIPVPAITNDDADLDLEALEQSWAEFESRRREQLAELEGRVAEKDQLMQQSLKSMEEHYKKVIADLQASGDSPATADAVPESDEASATPTPKAHSSAASINSIIEAEKEKMAAQAAAEELRRRVAKSDAEVERLKGVETYLKQQLAAMESAITAKNAEIESIQKKLETNKTSYEEKVVFLQMQSTAAKAKEDERSRDTAAHRATVDKLTAQISALQRLVEEKDLSNKSNKDMIQALQTRLIELEPELALGRDKIAQLERNNNAQALMKAEQSALTTSLRTDLKNALDEVEAGKRRCRELEEFKVKAEGQLLRLAALTEQNQTLQSAIEDKDSLITRMRAEQQANERNHAMRTAMLATCEAQLEALQAEVGEKDATCREAIERVTSLQTALAAAEARLAERVKEAAAEIASLESRIATIERDRDATIQSLERTHEEATEALKRDHAKKAAMARTLLSEKEEEVRTLSARVAELHDEITSGAPQERKIFELATTQARRETLHGLHNDTRELAFTQLQGKLAARDFELARAQQALVALQSEVGELRRTHQREGINMDYLKNIVIQYMTFPAQSSEKMSLVPVLAMLLQFTPKELSAVQRAALLEPAQGGLWSSLGLGGAGGAAPAAPIAMPVFSSSRPAKEVKRPAVPIGANRTGAAAAGGTGSAAEPTVAAAGTSSGSSKGVTFSSGASTAAAMLTQQSTIAGGAVKGSNGSAADASHPDADSSSEYQPPTPITPFTHAISGRGGPLSPASPSSNSDADHDTVGTYSPPKVSPYERPLNNQDSPSDRGIAQQSPPPQAQGSLMVESHTDRGASEDPLYATPAKAAPAPTSTSTSANTDRSNNNNLPVGLPHPNQTSSVLASTSGSGSFRGGAQRARGSAHRMPINRAGSMNASDYEFQQKLKSIGSDILSLDNSMSYDDAELDMTGDATYVDYEEGIEEGDELDDGQDGTSV